MLKHDVKNYIKGKAGKGKLKLQLFSCNFSSSSPSLGLGLRGTIILKQNIKYQKVQSRTVHIVKTCILKNLKPGCKKQTSPNKYYNVAWDWNKFPHLRHQMKTRKKKLVFSCLEETTISVHYMTLPSTWTRQNGKRQNTDDKHRSSTSHISWYFYLKRPLLQLPVSYCRAWSAMEAWPDAVH